MLIEREKKTVRRKKERQWVGGLKKCRQSGEKRAAMGCLEKCRLREEKRAGPQKTQSGRNKMYSIQFN